MVTGEKTRRKDRRKTRSQEIKKKMTVRILLIGNGGREHAIADALMRSNQDVKLYAVMSAKNPGIAKLCDEYKISDLTNFIAMKDIVVKMRPHFAIIGPEAPLEAGISDFLAEYKVPAFGPTKVLAQLETSKSFTRDIMEKYDVPGRIKHKSFTTMEGVEDFLNELGEVVIKPDGLTGGKGVKVQGDHFKTLDEGLEYCQQLISKKNKIIIEEKLVGEEFSLQSFVSGATVVDCPAAQDHKRAYEDDKGPNTGGMGSYSSENHSLPMLEPEDLEFAHSVTVQMASALMKECGEAYKGIMYGGFMKTKTGVKLLEYNARFGDPEAMNVLVLLKTDFVKVCEAVVEGKLDRIKIEFENKATVCKYAVPEGYPTKPVKGEKIDLSKVGAGNDVKVYYASVDEKNGELIMLGSRAVAVVGIGNSISEAEGKSEFAVSRIRGPVFHRSDIGTRRLIERRIKALRRLLSD